MDALKNYLGALWKESINRRTEAPAFYGKRDYAAYDRHLARPTALQYSSITQRWELTGGGPRIYLAARNGVALSHDAGKAA